MKRFTSQSHEETFALGVRLGRCAEAGVVVALQGELGAGKTVFAKGVGFGLGVVEDVTSPTFVLLQLYPDARIPLAHADLYRLGGFDEFLELGLEEMLPDSVTLIEWIERCPEALPADGLWVEFAFQGTERVLSIRATGPKHTRILDAWFA